MENKKSIPKDEAIRKGIIGHSMGGVNWKAIVSGVEGKYYTAHVEVLPLKPGESLRPGELFKQGQLVEVKEAKDFKEALKDAMTYGL